MKLSSVQQRNQIFIHKYFRENKPNTFRHLNRVAFLKVKTPAKDANLSETPTARNSNQEAEKLNW